jgi:Cys-tRNA(Pro) deacylase
VKKNSSVERVRGVLDTLGIPIQIQELPHSTRTAVEAAQAVGSTVDQIVKSLVFITAADQPILILTSGSNQVDEKHVTKLLGVKIRFADAAFVREQTGFAIGGVSPYGLKKKIPIFIDQDLLEHDLVWAAAGSSHAVFSVKPQDLANTTGGQVISVY